MFELFLDLLALVGKFALLFLFFYMLIRSWPLESSVTDEDVCGWIEEAPPLLHRWKRKISKQLVNGGNTDIHTAKVITISTHTHCSKYSLINPLRRGSVGLFISESYRLAHYFALAVSFRFRSCS